MPKPTKKAAPAGGAKKQDAPAKRTPRGTLFLEVKLDDADTIVAVHDDGTVVAEVEGEDGHEFPSWTAFCEDHDLDPNEMFEEVHGQIDDGIREEAEENGADPDDPDAYLKRCARLSEE